MRRLPWRSTSPDGASTTERSLADPALDPRAGQTGDADQRRPERRTGVWSMRLEARKGGHVLSDIKHGGHHLVEESPRAAELARTQESITAAPAVAADTEFSTPFGYLFDDIAGNAAAHLPADDPAAVVAGLGALGDAMIDDAVATGGPGETPAGNSAIPPVYTYWGQFIDHDLTANTDRDSAISDITSPTSPRSTRASWSRTCATCACRRSTSTASMATARRSAGTAPPRPPTSTRASG
jgi:hypothetical protein